MEMDGMMIFLCGVYCVGMAIFHMQFPRLFDWKHDLPKMNVPNRAIIQIANLRLIYFFLLVALICFFFPTELVGTSFGRFFMIGMSVFWISRFIEQFVFLKVDHRMVQLLNYLFLIGALLFALPVIL